MPQSPVQLSRVNPDQINLSDPEFWKAPRDHRESVFASLRKEAPVKFFPEIELMNFPVGPGYWALTKHEDIWHASRNPDLLGLLRCPRPWPIACGRVAVRPGATLGLGH